jgi:hypothetical protein
MVKKKKLVKCPFFLREIPGAIKKRITTCINEYTLSLGVRGRTPAFDLGRWSRTSFHRCICNW